MAAALLINIDVPSLEAGITFYGQGLGFRFQRYLFERSVAEMRLGEMRICLIAQQAGTQPVAGSATTRDYADHWTPVHLDIAVEDIDAAIATALAAGARSAVSRQEHRWGMLAPMRDPFGHGFCLIQFQNGGYDLVAE